MHNYQSSNNYDGQGMTILGVELNDKSGHFLPIKAIVRFVGIIAESNL